MATFQQNLRGVGAARKKLDDARESLYAARLKVQNAENPESFAEVRHSLASAMARVENARHDLDRRIAILLDLPDHRDAARELDAQIPVLFFPVRLETRFVTVNRRPELLVRVYPDDIHVHSFEERLTAAEIDAGEGYWRGLAAVNRSAAEDADDAKGAIWEKLVAPTGVQRALWIVKQTRPENWRPDFTGADDALRFPTLDRTKTHDWTRAPQTQLLPDRFVAQIYQGGKLAHTAVGKPIPDTVFMGPDPFLAEDAFKERG